MVPTMMPDSSSHVSMTTATHATVTMDKLPVPITIVSSNICTLFLNTPLFSKYLYIC